MWRALVLAVVTGCISPAAKECADGVVCPADTMCLTVGGFAACATQADIDACKGQVEGFACDPEAERKVCHDAVCIDTCGDSRMQPYETCDDGNQVAGDDCSATCHIEGCGNDELDRVLGEECDFGAGISGDGCSSTCKIEKPVWTELTQEDQTARAAHAMATMPATASRTAMTVQFGGIGPSGMLDETWTWHGVELSPGWAQAFPARSPSARHGHAMTYDSARDRVLLFGGYSPGGFLDDLWEWDGEVWTDVSPPSRPTARAEMGLAYDPSRNVTVVVGGRKAQGVEYDVWEWNGTSWANPSTLTPHPPDNTYVQLAYDAMAGELIYCGQPENPATWKYDGAWTNLNVACPTSGTVAPKPNRMTYDARRGTLVLVQGGGNVYEWSASGRTWTADGTVGNNQLFGTAITDDGTNLLLFGGHLDGRYDDTTWFMKQTWRRGGQPTDTFAFFSATQIEVQKRARGGAAYDPKRSRAVSFGGLVPSFANVTWLFDLDRWHNLDFGAAQTKPPMRYDQAYAVDTDRGVIVMFGGVNDNTLKAPPLLLHGDTWELGGMFPDVWIDRTPAGATNSPSKRMGAAMAYDAARKQMILFGGDEANPSPGVQLGDTWAWDGAMWTKLSPPMSPGARSHASMAFDVDRGVLVLFGGRMGTLGYLNDTWEWDGTTWTQRDSSQTSVVVPAERAEANLVYDPLRHRVVLLGGGAVAQNGSHYSDVWEWLGDHWEKTFEDARLARSGAQAFYDPFRGGIVVYGGEVSTSEGITDETWLLRWESLASRETCRFAEDDLDGDSLRGCDDPDCAPRCFECDNTVCQANEDRLICPADCP